MCMQTMQVYVIKTRCVTKFKNGQTNHKDKQRTAWTVEILTKITDIITNVGRLFIKQIANLEGIPSGLLFTVLI